MKEKQGGPGPQLDPGELEEYSPTGKPEKACGVRKKSGKRVVMPRLGEEERMFRKEGVASCIKCCCGLSKVRVET